MWRYQLLLVILSPILVIYTCWTGLKYKNFTFIKQRLGFGYPEFSSSPLWLHAASVGEIMAAKPLLEKLLNTGVAEQILLTTTTPTGGAVAKKLSTVTISYCYLPIDWPRMIQGFLKTVKPKSVIIMETELWPNLFSFCDTNDIPVLIVNGRLSNRTLQASKWIRNLYKSTLQHATRILTRSDVDTKNYISLGAMTEKVKTIGNIKFAAQTTKSLSFANHPCNNRPYVLFASTHDDEEYMAAKIWENSQFQDYLLVIVPRHPARLNAIMKNMNSLAVSVAIRSKNEPVTSETDIYIADTIGELQLFMYFADLVFMGGSMVPIGGHNILEPALLGKPIVFGPYMDNFDDEKTLFLEADAAIQVQSEEDLAKSLSRILPDKPRLEKLGYNARLIIERHSGIADNYINEISSVLDYSN